jgi:hypothetical protein
MQESLGVEEHRIQRAALMHLLWLSVMSMRRSADSSCQDEAGMLEDSSYFSWYTNTKRAAIIFFLPAAMSDCRAIASRRERQEQRNGRLLTSAIMPIGVLKELANGSIDDDSTKVGEVKVL